METIKLIGSLITSVGFPAVMALLMFKLVDKVINSMQDSQTKQWEEILKVVEDITTAIHGIKEDLDAKRD